MTDGNTYAIDHYLLEREDYDQREENDAELFNLRCEVDVLTGMLADLHDAQTYTYIGKDGKSVLARDLEDQLHEMKAKLAEVEKERDDLKAQPKGITIDMANAPQLPPEAFDPIKDMLIEGLIAGGNEWKDRAEAAEAHIAHLENHIEAVAKDTHKIMVVAEAVEAALPAVYRLGLAAGAKLAETHFVDAGVTGQREHTAGQIIAAAIRATSTLTTAELMARINEGEKE